MLVHFLTDEPTKIPAIRAILGPEYDVAPQVLGDGSTSVISNGVLMVDADLRKAAPVEQLKLALHDLRDVSEKLFVVQKHLHHMVAQAFALGATSVVSRPKEIVYETGGDRSRPQGGASRRGQCLAQRLARDHA